MAENIDWKDLELKRPRIGFGTYSDVFMAIWNTKNEKKIKIAVKRFRDIVKDDNIDKEINNLSTISHEHIIKIFGISEDIELRTHILMEYADCGSLSVYLHKNKLERSRSYHYSHSLKLLNQCAKAMAFLHERNPKILHRDLKTHNLLLFNDYQILKVGDFGTVTQMASQLTKEVGTAPYMAPEICNNKPYTEKCDVYSFGIVVWEVMSVQKPFSHLKNVNDLAIMMASTNGDRPPLSAIDAYDNSDFLKKIIENCWDSNPSKRPSMKHLEVSLKSDSKELQVVNVNILKPEIPGNGLPLPSMSDPTLWYHGELIFKEAEDRLTERGQFLVWKNKDVADVYVFSYLEIIHHHIEIRSYYGDLYAEGKQFSTLSSFVNFFTSYLNIKGYLVAPVPHHSVLASSSENILAIALLSHLNLDEFSDELSFSKGDIFIVHNELGDDWLWVTAHRSREQGMIFRRMIQIVDKHIDPNIMFPWFFPNCTFHESEQKLRLGGPNSFLVRQSEVSQGDYFLCINIDKKPLQILIEKNEWQLRIRDQMFNTLEDIISTYQENPIVGDQFLTNAIINPDDVNYADRFIDSSTESTYQEIHTSLSSCRLIFQEKSKKSQLHEDGLSMKLDYMDYWTERYGRIIQHNDQKSFCVYYDLNQIKPTVLVPLSKIRLYECHESIWAKDNCFALKGESLFESNLIAYFHIPGRMRYDRWIRQLKPTIKNGILTIKNDSYLKILILNGSKLPEHLPVYCIISLDGVKVAKTKIKQGPSCVWNELIKFDNIHEHLTSLTITTMLSLKETAFEINLLNTGFSSYQNETHTIGKESVISFQIQHNLKFIKKN